MAGENGVTLQMSNKIIQHGNLKNNIVHWKLHELGLICN